MKKILALATIAVVAVVMILATIAPEAMADQNNPKSAVFTHAVCHNGETIWVAPEAVLKHIAYGDTLGPCL